MRLRKLLTIALVSGSLVVAAKPSQAQLSPGEASVKQSLEQKLHEGVLTPQEMEAYKTLVQKDHPGAFTDSAEHAGGELFGGATALIVIAVGATALCAFGLFVACPLMAVGG